jgi:signal transduction histidine kinase
MRPLSTHWSIPTRTQYDIKIIGIAVLYYLGARLGYLFSFPGTTDLAFWPSSGLAFAMAILFGRSIWPGITIGSLVANIMAYWHQALPPQVVIMMSSTIALAATLEAVLGQYLVQVWIRNPYPFSCTRNTFRFLGIGLSMPVITALISTINLNAFHLTDDASAGAIFLFYWTGNTVAIILFTPLLLSATRPVLFTLPWRRWIEVLIFFTAVAIVCLALQIEFLRITIQHALPILVLPFLLWLAFRFELIAAMTGVTTVALLALYFTTNGRGPFVLADPHNTMLLFQIFVAVISISCLILGATVKERREAQQQLKAFNHNLEAMVHERTQALNEQVTTRLRAEQKLQQTNEELSKRNTELDNFVYSVSHDLRAPIASVLGLINLAKKDSDTEMKDMYLDMIHRSALQQDHFIREILDQSRNARLEIKREEIFFEPLVNETFNQLKFATSTGKSVRKIISIQQEKPFYSDRWRLKVILNNILSNAIRYRNGRDPVIRINVDIADHKAVLSVEDNGRGISKEHLPNLCQMFYRATDDGAGSGLGLYIVKETINKLQGNINIDSEEGKGTTVRLEIPELV